MMKISAAVAALSLLATSLVAATPAAAQPLSAPTAVAAISPAAAGIAAAKKKKPAAAKIVIGKTKTTVKTKPYRYTKKISRPALQGSTAKNRRLFAKNVDALFAAEYKAMKAGSITSYSLRGCTKKVRLTATAKHPGIYKGRYASVVMLFQSGNSCLDYENGFNNVRSFAMDLKTGKKVPLTKFVDPNDFTTKTATHKAYKKSNSCVLKFGATAYPGFNEMEGNTQFPDTPFGRPTAWSVSAKGLRIWHDDYAIAPGYCGPATTTLLPWGEIATKKAMSGKIRTRFYVANYKWLKDYGPRGSGSGDFIMFSTKGRKVAVAEGGFPAAGVSCGFGVRSGKTASFSSNFTPYWYRLKLADTSSNPKLAASSLKGGYKPATSKQIKEITEFMSPKNAFGFCGR